MSRPRRVTDGGRDRDGRSQEARNERDDRQRDERAGRPRDERTEQEDSNARRGSEEFADRVASSAVRIGLVFVGLVITVFALGQAVGVNFLGMVAQALGTQTGQWLLVALAGILLIVVAQRGLASGN